MDPVYKNSPPKMSDGRYLSDHRSSNTRELSNMQRLDVVDSYSYKDYLLNNGARIMDAQWCKMRKSAKCGMNGCFHNHSTVVPNSTLKQELREYTNSRRNGGSKGPKCNVLSDYRLTITAGSSKQCNGSC